MFNLIFAFLYHILESKTMQALHKHVFLRVNQWDFYAVTPMSLLWHMSLLQSGLHGCMGGVVVKMNDVC